MHTMIGLGVHIECEVDDLGGRLKEEDALWLAVMRILDRIVCGDVAVGGCGMMSIGVCFPLVDGVSDVIGALDLQPLLP